MATRVSRTINLAREIGKEVALNILKKTSQNRDEIEKVLNSIDVDKEFTVGKCKNALRIQKNISNYQLMKGLLWV